MERAEAVRKLRGLIGKDIRQLADQYGITVWKGDRKNKGWFGHTIEALLGLPPNTSKKPNFGSWELKCIPVKRLKSGKVVFKETMAISNFSATYLLEHPFENSSVYGKLRSAVICVRMFESQKELSSKLVAVAAFDLEDKDLYRQLKADYDLAREALRTRGYKSLTGKMGVLIQPRTKGKGHGSISRAFYARKQFLEIIISDTLKQLNS